MATSGQGIWTPFGAGSSMRDYKHAAQIFRSNDFARSPKTKYLFYVNFVLNPNATASPYAQNELNYLVKNIEMPKFEIQVQEVNQYNRKVLIQKEIKYSPITVKLHDDNQGTLRHFWQSYYNYYYADGRYANLDFQTDDKYTNRRSSKWGLDTGASVPYLSYIEIFSMYHGTAEKITLENPLISNFSHDNHDYSEGQGIVEASMTFHYTGVRYDDGIDAMYGIPGFGPTAPYAYDTEFSSLEGNNQGQQVDPKTGQLYDPIVSTPTQNIPTDPNVLQMQQYLYNRGTVAINSITNNQLTAILENNAVVNASPFVFPVIGNQKTVNQDYGSVPVSGTVAFSDGQPISSPLSVASVYTAGSWQNSMYQKGYTQEQITAADSFIQSANLPKGTNIQQVAEQYVQNPNSNALANVTSNQFGQPATITPNVTFGTSSATTQPIYNSQTWQSSLLNQGYTQADVSTAQRFLSNLKLSSNANLHAIASNYINNSKTSGTNGLNPLFNPLNTTISTTTASNSGGGLTPTSQSSSAYLTL
jgi:hypothetical protein